MSTSRNLDDDLATFDGFLRAHDGGASLAEIEAALREVIARVQETGKAGTLTYTLRVEPLGGSGALSIVDDVKTKLPPLPRNEGVYYPSRDERRLFHADQPPLPMSTQQEGLDGVTSLRSVTGRLNAGEMGS